MALTTKRSETSYFRLTFGAWGEVVVDVACVSEQRKAAGVGCRDGQREVAVAPVGSDVVGRSRFHRIRRWSAADAGASADVGAAGEQCIVRRGERRQGVRAVPSMCSSTNWAAPADGRRAGTGSRRSRVERVSCWAPHRGAHTAGENGVRRRENAAEARFWGRPFTGRIAYECGRGYWTGAMGAPWGAAAAGSVPPAAAAARASPGAYGRHVRRAGFRIGGPRRRAIASVSGGTIRIGAGSGVLCTGVPGKGMLSRGMLWV